MTTNFSKQIYANNATSTLSYAIDGSSTSISLVDASLFPQPAVGQYFSVTIGSGSEIEIVEVYGRSGNTLTNCIRGAQGTVARSFGAGALAENRLTADSIQNLSRDQDKLVNVGSILSLTKPELLNNNSCLLDDVDDDGNPLVAFEYSGRWRFTTHPVLLVDQEILDVPSQVSSTSLLYSSSQDISELFVRGGLIVQAVSGLNRGLSRFIESATSTVVSWSTPFPHAFAYGDRLQVYQSASSAIAWLSSQISAVSGGQSSQQFAIQEEIRKTAYKAPVLVATVSSIALSGLPVIDGVQTQEGNRVLVKDQASPSQNGIYVVSASGWTRAADANSSAKVAPSMLVPVASGTENQDSVWILDVDTPVALGVTSLPFKNLNHLYAKLASPAFSGTPTAPTAAQDTSSTQLATTAFVLGQAGAGVPSMDGLASAGTSSRFSRADHVHPSDSSKAPLVSPAFSGAPTATTADQFNSSTRVATTEFVQRALGNSAGISVKPNVTEYITAADLGKTVVLSNATTVYLPKVASLPSGATVTIRSEASSCTSIICLYEDNGDWVSLDPKYTFTSRSMTLYLMPQEIVTLTLYKTGVSGGYPTVSGRWLATAGDIVGQAAPGSIAYFASSVPPFGYVMANLGPYSRAGYTRLFNAIGTFFGAGDGVTTFNVPDLRGEFVRGWDYGRGVDAGRVFGSYQSDDLESHSHRGVISTPVGNRYINLNRQIGVSTEYATGDNTDDSTSPYGDTETRPRNVAMLACIKY